MNMKKAKVGDTVFVVAVANYGHNYIARIASVGRKYIKVVPVDGGYSFEREFCIENGNEKGDYSPAFILYPSEAAYIDECARKKLLCELIDYLREKHADAFTLEELKSAARILGLESAILDMDRGV